jgi:hypothetical protein
MPQWVGRGTTANPGYMGEYGLDHLHHMRICAEVIQLVTVFTTIPAARLRQSRIDARQYFYVDKANNFRIMLNNPATY